MSEQLVIQPADGLEGLGTTASGYENVAELVIPSESAFGNLRRFQTAEEDSVSPLEYAFHLLTGVHDRTVIDMGCGTGLSTVILAKLGARVVSIDNSDAHLEMTHRRVQQHGVGKSVTLIRSHGCSLPIADSAADRVLCHSISLYSDPLLVARQIRRILKPGGRAVFHEETRTRKHGTIRWEYASSLSRAVGLPGKHKEFWFATGLLFYMGVPLSSTIARASQRFDAGLLRRFPFVRSLAWSLVWEARKES